MSLAKKAFFDRRFLATNVIALSGVMFFLFFPTTGTIEMICLSLFSFLFLPFFFIKFILREPLHFHGFSWGGKRFRTGVVSTLFLLILFSLTTWLFLHTPLGQTAFDNLGIITELRESFLSLLGFFLLSGWLLFQREFFFRGFFLLSWKRAFGIWSLLAHGIFLLFFSFFELDRTAPDFGSIILLSLLWSSCASLIAFLSESFLFSFLFSFASVIIVIMIAFSSLG